MPRYRRILVFSITAAVLGLGVVLAFSLFGLRADTLLQDAVTLGPERGTTGNGPIQNKTPTFQRAASSETSASAIGSTMTSQSQKAAAESVATASLMLEEVSDSSHSSDSKAVAQAATDVSDDMLADIEAIRRQVGISALPFGDGAEESSSSSFRQALQQVADEQRGPAASVSDARVAEPNAAAADSPTHSKGISALELSQADQAFVDSMQQTIELLQQRAEAAESRQRYDSADRMRRTIKRIRHEIRLLIPEK